MPSDNHRLSTRLEATDTWSNARALTIKTLHGEVATPIFMPVATHAALRYIDLDTAHELDYQILLANTYHLMIRPGKDTFSECGGIHTFMRWQSSVLTDSGGFQLFSLSKQFKVKEQGAIFRSYTDGAQMLLSPESSIEMQMAIGSDIMMVLDHCIPSTSEKTALRQALELTTRWAERSLKARGESPQALFGIVQGGCDPELRRESAARITALGFDGFALGGLAVGEERSIRDDTIELSTPLLPADRPRYVMGIGTPIDLLEAVKRGADMFDCIMPTALAGQGVAFTSRGKVDLRRGVYRGLINTPLDPECSCLTCGRFSRGYLHQLIKVREPIGWQHLALHNLTFYRSLMRRIRNSILAGGFKEVYEGLKPTLEAADLDYPPAG